MSDYVQTHSVLTSFNSSNSWSILSDIEVSIKYKVESIGAPLKEWNIQINYGVKTGFNEAFIVDTQKRNEILDNCQSEDERSKTAEIIRPILRGRDIRRYSYQWSNLWIINTHNGIKGELERVHIEDYPAIKQHIDRHWDKVVKRADQGDTPYNLRNCAYLDLLSQPKIVWGEISDKSKFCLDTLGEFTPEATTFMLSGDNLFYLLAFLNCSISEYLFSTIGTTTGVGTVRWKKYKILELPIPEYDASELQIDLINTCKNAVETREETPVYEKRINSIIYQIYGLTEEEIEYVEMFIHGK